jgi:1-deoxy-D-xylulose-5-phosphate reductoisomerase
MQYPGRLSMNLPSLDLTEIGKLTFCKPDHDRFPCLRLGYESLRVGGTMPAAMNAANEVAVEAFLNRGIRFTNIAEIIRSTMDDHSPKDVETLEDALEADRWAREKAESLVVALAR